MKKSTLIIIVVVLIGTIIIASSVDYQLANANSRKKINFTKTLASSQDPGIGHENHQFTLLLAPNSGTLYYGTVTFTSSDPVEIAVLHEINQEESKGQSTWTVDGKTIYALSLIDTQSKSGSLDFTGSALAFHRSDKKPFTVTASIDGWIRGQSPESVPQKIEPIKEFSYELSRPNVLAKIPLHKGFYKNSTTYYIITDSSDKTYAEQISEKQKWQVTHSSLMSNLKDSPIGKIYLFTNGINGDGIFGSQNEILSKTPQSPKYSSMNKVIEVSWKKGQNPEVLHSEDEVLKAKEGGRVDIRETEIILNSPQISWSTGEMKIHDEKTIDTEPYANGQVTKIDKDNLIVTFISHRTWSYDGKTIYQIFTDAVPSGPADMMGITLAETLNDIASNSTSTLYQFKNGITGSGSLEFQPNIFDGIQGDENYSPLCKIYLVEWNNPENAKILETKSDIDAFLSSGDISIDTARPMNSDHIINCPIINPFQ